MSTQSRLWLLICIVLAISSCSAFGQQDDGHATLDAAPIDGDPNCVLTALYSGSGLAVTCGDTLADVGSLSTPATLCSAVGTFSILTLDEGTTIDSRLG
jgi:hypothetical protein